MDLTIDQFISITGIALTAIFSCLVWWATRATAKATKATVAAAEETLRLNERLATAEETRNNEYRLIMKSQLSQFILNESKKAENALADFNSNEIFGRLKTAPESLNVTKEELAKYFSREEAEIISKAWTSYESYREKYFHRFYRGHEIQLLSEHAPPVSEDLNKVINILK